MKDDVVVVDANHPLAGMTLRYAVKVRDVREATERRDRARRAPISTRRTSTSTAPTATTTTSRWRWGESSTRETERRHGDRKQQDDQPWEWDVRVRERNLRKGMLDDKDVEKHLPQLPDVADQAESITIAQPALGGRED